MNFKTMFAMIFGFMIGFGMADVAIFRTDCESDLKECGKKHAQEMDHFVKKIGYPRSHSTVFVVNHYMTTMIY